jgi:hypothetical protein
MIQGDSTCQNEESEERRNGRKVMKKRTNPKSILKTFP